MESILKELIDEGIIADRVIDLEPLNGGTSSKLGVIYTEAGQKLVVKSNDPQVIEAESTFLSFYQDIPLFPKLIYTEPSYKYILYTYVEGEMSGHLKKETLKDLVQKVMNHYKPASTHNKWGYMEEAVFTWQDFLLSEVKVGCKRLSAILSNEDHQLVMSLINQANRNLLDTPYLLHGDCGIHNFLFKNEHLNGVIDPTPVLGMPIYDLVSAFCSTPYDLTKETITKAANALNFAPITEEILIEEVMIGLYIRISRCVEHHPQDLHKYLKAWNEFQRGGNMDGALI